MAPVNSAMACYPSAPAQVSSMRASLLAPALTVVLLLPFGCRKLDPIPQDADGAASWLYRNQDAEDTEEIIAAMDLVIDALAIDPEEEFVEGLLLPLDAASVEVVGRVAVETLPTEEQIAVTEEELEAGTYVVLEEQQGMVVASIIPCAVADVVGVVIRTDQDVVQGGYDVYDRAYTTDENALDNGEMLGWETNYTISALGATYDATILGQLRFLDEAKTYAVARAYLPTPGEFTRGGRYFRQDYQLDLFAPTEDGQTIHVFAVWRDMNLGGFHSSNAAYIATVSNAFRDADVAIADVCNPRE
ncbi:MAG: hypothetical protein ACJATT_004117 [Myxococcota bacterium]